jgi:hypothetical protein
VSGLFRRLAGQALGTAPVIRSVRALPFVAAGGFESLDEESPTIEASSPASLKPILGHARAPSAPSPVVRREPSESAAPRSHHSSAPRDAVSPESADESFHAGPRGPSPLLPGSKDQDRGSSRRRASTKLESASDRMPLENRESTESPERLATEIAVPGAAAEHANSSRGSDRSEQRALPARLLASVPFRSSRAFAEAPPRIRARDASAAAAEPDEVHVHIGRIELMAVHEAPPARPQRTTARAPMSLEEYLAHRERRV